MRFFLLTTTVLITREQTQLQDVWRQNTRVLRQSNPDWNTRDVSCTATKVENDKRHTQLRVI